MIPTELPDVRAGLRRNPVLTGTAALSAVGLLVALVGLVASGDEITGVAAWLKPAKFGISITIYALTLGWLLTLVEGHRRLVTVAGAVTGLALVGELVLIDLQVVRGTTSHFNDADGFDSAVFSAMGALIAAVFVAALAVAVVLVRQRSLTGPLGTAVRAGLAIALLGMAEAGLMLVNREWHSGGGHTVGAPDGGPGLPLVGWSTEHGDLRVAHFVGIHGLQVLPLLALVLLRFRPSDDRLQQAWLRLTAAAYAGLVLLLAWQAEREQPLLRPDAVTIAVALAGCALVTVAALVLLRRRPVTT